MFLLKIDKNLYLRICPLEMQPFLFRIIDDLRENLRNWLPWLNDIKLEDEV